MISSIIFFFILVLSANAGTITIYNAPYTYQSDIVDYATTNTFIIGIPPEVKLSAKAKPSTKVKLSGYIKNKKQSLKSRRYPSLPAAFQGFNGSLVKNILIRSMGIKEKPVSKSLILTIYYPLNVYKLTSRQEALLISKLARYKNKKLYIEGYTDCSGSREYNNKLAQKRADTVILFLKKHGYKAVKIPSYGNYHTLKAAKLSRRTEVYAER